MSDKLKPPTRRPGNTGSPPFLVSDPPPLIARSVSVVLLISFATAIVLASVIELPVTVTGAFVLAPLRGADPLRAPRSGIVSDVFATEGERVTAGAALLTIRSQFLAEQAGEKQSLGLGVKSSEGRIASEKKRRESQLKVDIEEQHRLEQRIVSIGQQLKNAKKEIAIAELLVQQAKDAHEQGVGSLGPLYGRQMDLVRAEGNYGRLEGEQGDARSALGRLSREMELRERESETFERTQKDEIERAKLRSATIDENPVQGEGNLVAVKAPCDGIVVRLHIKAKGAVVAEGNPLMEVVCEGEPLEAEMAVEGSGFGLVRKDQPVKLFYDAFPYQRHGSRRADVRWIGPSGGGDRPKLRILARLYDEPFVVAGETYPLMPGMTGNAEIIVDRRTPIGYLFAPMRELRERMRTP